MDEVKVTVREKNHLIEAAEGFLELTQGWEYFVFLPAHFYLGCLLYHC